MYVSLRFPFEHTRGQLEATCSYNRDFGFNWHGPLVREMKLPSPLHIPRLGRGFFGL